MTTKLLLSPDASAGAIRAAVGDERRQQTRHETPAFARRPDGKGMECRFRRNPNSVERRDDDAVSNASLQVAIISQTHAIAAAGHELTRLSAALVFSVQGALTPPDAKSVSCACDSLYI